MHCQKFRKVEIRDLGLRQLDLNIKIQNGCPLWYRVSLHAPIDALGVTISIIVCGRHGCTRFEDWIFDSDDLQYAGRMDFLRFIDLGQYHDFEVVNPAARLKIRIQRSDTGTVSWDVIEQHVLRHSMAWPPRLSVV